MFDTPFLQRKVLRLPESKSSFFILTEPGLLRDEPVTDKASARAASNVMVDVAEALEPEIEFNILFLAYVKQHFLYCSSNRLIGHRILTKLDGFFED